MSCTGEVVVTYPGFDGDDPRTAGLLRDAGLSIRFEPRLRERSTDEVVKIVGDAVAGVVSTDPFDASVFARCPNLRLLARVGVGTDTIDLEAATDAGVAVTTTPGMNAATAADHALALMLACCRRIVENDQMIRVGAWDRGGALNGGDLTGLTVGIIGLGSIGQAVARRLRGFDAVVTGNDLPAVSCDDVVRVDLPELLASSDVITVHVPLLPSTRGLIGARELATVKPGTILVNTSRGGVVDEGALVAALEDGRIGHAGIDVFAQEPPTGSPLLSMSNVVLSPHIAGISVKAQQRMLEKAAMSIVEVLAGRPTIGLVNPGALARARTASESAT